MTSDSSQNIKNTWKSVERRIAKALNTKRTPLSGGNSSITSSDTLHSKYYVEIKQRARIPFHTVFENVKEKAKKENKIPMMVIHEKYSRDYIVFMKLNDFIELMGVENDRNTKE